MTNLTTIEVPIKGMDCAECIQNVQHTIKALPDVESFNVFLASEKAAIRLDPSLVDLPATCEAELARCAGMIYLLIWADETSFEHVVEHRPTFPSFLATMGLDGEHGKLAPAAWD